VFIPRFHPFKAIDAEALTGYFLPVIRRNFLLEVTMQRRFAAGILAVFALAVLTAGADDFWVKKDWKTWTAADCKKLMEDSPWAKRVLHENESDVSHIPSATQGASVDKSAAGLNQGAGEINYVVQIRSAEPMRHAVIRQQQIDKGYDKMSDADKKAFDAQMEQLYNRPGDPIMIHVKYYGNRPQLTTFLNNAWDSLPADTIPADLVLLPAGGGKVIPLTFMEDASGGPEFDVTFPRTALAQGLKSFKLQIPNPAMGDFGASKVIAEFKTDKMAVEGKAAF
jgi:hypothetical protein